MVIYQNVVKPVLFKMDPEFVHDRFTFAGRVLGSNPLTRGAVSCVYKYKNPMLVQTIDGITFQNPIGLAAGFDKDAKLMKILPAMGFGFEEVGSITYEPYAGNPKPRLVRLPKDNGIIVYYGLKNKGSKVLRPKFIKDGKRIKYDLPIGISVAKTNKDHKTQQDKVTDWVSGIKAMKDCGDYLTINLSCPNTFDKQNFCEWNFLEILLSSIEKAKVRITVPVYLKISADISFEQLDYLVGVARKHPFVRGFILTNLVKDRSTVKLKSPKSAYEPYKGGISGPLVKKKSIELVRHLYKTTKGEYTIIACGGVLTAEDAYEYLRAGANLIQMITGMIYNGPATIKNVNKGLVKLAQADGYKNISEATGAEFRRVKKIGVNKKKSVKRKK
jgi:dihydroorotate dehydrogenase